MLRQILWTACVTPFSADSNKVDYESFKRCLVQQEQAGNGVLLLGSTGESLSLSDQEREEIVDFALSLNLKTEIMVGVPSHNLKAATKWLAHCNSLPIGGYLFTTPIYTKPGIIGQAEWFTHLLDHAKHPAMLYNIPGRAAIKLHPEAVAQLVHQERILGIKDSSGSIESVIDYQSSVANVALYCGDDYMMPAFAAEGAVGLVSVASNVWPAATRRYVELCLARQEFDSKTWWHACKSLFLASNPIPVKALMRDLGFIQSDALRLPLTQKDLPKRVTLLEHHNNIEKWYIKNGS